MNNLKRYLPTLVKSKLDTLEYKNKDELYCVVDMIFRSYNYRKTDDYTNTYRDIPSSYFSDLFTKYKPPIEYLILNNIIECDGNYSKEGGKCLGYRLKEEYLSDLISVNIEKYTIKKRIIKNRNDNRKISKAFSIYHNFYKNNFNIDYNKAIDYLNTWRNTENLNNDIRLEEGRIDIKEYSKQKHKIQLKHCAIFISIASIKDGDLFFKKNKTNGRIDTNLTSLKGEYKRFIISDEELYSIDIVNSQPFILSLVLDESKIDENELMRYKLWTSTGQFYENFGKAVYTRTNKDISRKEIKELMFCIFYSKNASYCKQKNIFKSIFPSIYNFIKDKKKVKHNEFSIELQKAESEICIDIICNELDDTKISYYTIHDSWIVKKSDLNETKRIVMENFKNKYNNIPSLSIEKITI